MTTIHWQKGDRLSLTTTTAGAEHLEIVAFRRLASGTQHVVLASPATAARIRAGQADYRTIMLTGLGGRVREVETQRFHRLTASGHAVRLA